MRWYQGIDVLGLGLYLIICIFAIANISSVSDDSGTRQFIWLGISFVAGLIVFMTRATLFESISPIVYIIGVVLILGLHPFGHEILGQKNWYKFGPISFQPVEFAKIGTSMMLASYLSRGEFDINNKKHLYTAIGIIALPAIAVLSIPDTGSFLVFAAFVITLYREGLTGWLFGIVLLFISIFLGSIIVGYQYVIPVILAFSGLILFFIHRRINWNFYSRITAVACIIILCAFSFSSAFLFEKLPTHQRERVEVLYLGEKKFRDTSGYNLLYSKTAIGSGGLLGKGYKEGSVTRGQFVPEQSTDYIFCTVGEEWGFLGSSALVLVYILFIGRVYYLSEKQKSTFNRVFGYSFASILLLHFSMNLAMVMGIFPTVGIPLPFFSYGGSSLLAFSSLTFIFFKLNYNDRQSLV